MKYVTLVGDGMADYPLEELGGKTPLQAANIPNLDFLARRGKNGVAKTIPDALPAGSDIANLSILGYDPTRYYTGRGPLEAAGNGVFLSPKDVAFRCNLITEKDGMMADYSAGHISSHESKILIEILERDLSRPGVKFYPGVGYRHLLVLEDLAEHAVCTPPHDVVGRPIEESLPTGEGSELLRELIYASKPILEAHQVNEKRRRLGKNIANMIWLWGQGRKPNMPSFLELYHLAGSVISAVDLIKGIGSYAGLKVISVPGATGYFDTNYAGKAEYALRSLEERDFVFLHVEAPDEAAHAGDLEAKIRAIEDFDEKVVGTLLNGLGSFDEYKILVLPDHFTPIPVKTHTREPVPFTIYSSIEGADYVGEFNEDSAKNGIYREVEGYRLMGLFTSD
jgi:2,3-bisphosphoglycerate-independent phosphoglycerate mutase